MKESQQPDQTTTFQTFEDKFKALADEKRLQILSELSRRGGQHNVCEMCEIMDMQQSKLSYHIKILLDADLLTRETQGTWCYYKVNHAVLQQLATDLVNLFPLGE